MDRLKKIINRLLFPHIILELVLIVFSAVMLIYTFVYGYEDTPVAYITYLISAYAMTVFVISIVQLTKKGGSVVKSNPYAARYLSDRELRAEISLAASTLVNILYASFRIVSGILYHSVWSGAMGGYYIVLSLIRIILMRNVKKSVNQSWHSYRLCGILMLLLNVAMAGMAVQMIWQNKSYSYPGTMIFVSAMYTFYSFTIAIVNIIKFRRLNNPVLSAAKMLNFAGALMSMFALQTAMFVQFGGADDYRQIMNCITGISVCAAVLFMAVFMIIRASGKIHTTEVVDNG